MENFDQKSQDPLNVGPGLIELLTSVEQSSNRLFILWRMLIYQKHDGSFALDHFFSQHFCREAKLLVKVSQHFRVVPFFWLKFHHSDQVGDLRFTNHFCWCSKRVLGVRGNWFVVTEGAALMTWHARVGEVVPAHLFFLTLSAEIKHQEVILNLFGNLSLELLVIAIQQSSMQVRVEPVFRRD